MEEKRGMIEGLLEGNRKLEEKGRKFGRNRKGTS